VLSLQIAGAVVTGKPRIAPATARLDAKPRKPTRKQRATQRREVEAWQRKADQEQRTTNNKKGNR
jgi:hypothetical protein